jgi:hypothetical protein
MKLINIISLVVIALAAVCVIWTGSQTFGHDADCHRRCASLAYDRWEVSAPWPGNVHCKCSIYIPVEAP